MTIVSDLDKGIHAYTAKHGRPPGRILMGPSALRGLAACHHGQLVPNDGNDPLPDAFRCIPIKHVDCRAGEQNSEHRFNGWHLEGA